MDNSPIKLNYQERIRNAKVFAKLDLSINDGDKIPWDKPIPCSKITESVCLNGIWFKKAQNQEEEEENWKRLED